MDEVPDTGVVQILGWFEESGNFRAYGYGGRVGPFHGESNMFSSAFSASLTSSTKLSRSLPRIMREDVGVQGTRPWAVGSYLWKRYGQMRPRDGELL